ncbi:MAG TPA: GH25 family lysozyme [Rugosimonospora sp.]|nr:GH25 family lysozyme [Rugosimonospora sp.]
MTVFYPDVSHYQTGLTIEPGTPALCAKASEGTAYRDPSYATFRAGAAAQGVFFFAYHWLHRGATAEQAAFCHAVARTTPVMVDCEDTGDLPTLADCLDFAGSLRALGGRCTLLYLPHWYWQEHLGSPDLTPLAAHGLGLVSSIFTSYSDTGPGWAPYGGVSPVIWQFTDAYPYGGQLVDGNAYRGTTAQLHALVTGSSTRASATTHREEDEVTHLDLELHGAKVLTSPTVVGGAAWVCLSAEFGDARVRIALKHSGAGWQVHDNIAVTSGGDHVVVAKIDSSITKISAFLVSQTTGNTVVGLDVLPDHPL